MMANYPKTVTVADLPYTLTLLEGKKLTKDEVAEVARLVHTGGAVKGTIKEIEDRVRKAHLFIIARQGGEIVGAAALKAPEQGYRSTLRDKTGVDLSEDRYPAELGYVVISKACRGSRLSSTLMEELMSGPASTSGVFATTKLDRFYKTALPDLGFTYRGSYQNENGETVHLLTKPAA